VNPVTLVDFVIIIIIIIIITPTTTLATNQLLCYLFTMLSVARAA
jgi:hypothetical protein